VLEWVAGVVEGSAATRAGSPLTPHRRGVDLDRLCDGLVDLVERPAWHRRAACRGTPTAMWFPPASSRPDNQLVIRAAAICATCPVQVECEAVGRRQHDGVWAGVLRMRTDRRRKLARLAG
jgi:hypothetical protein